MNQKGYSWPEAILTLTIIVIVFGTLLPLATKMTSTLHYKKISMYAVETMYHGAILYKSNGKAKGKREIEGVHFDWIITDQLICVSYQPENEVIEKCLQQ